jgi:hypothetical protein
LHINTPDSNVLLLNNRTTLNTNVLTTLHFRTGVVYTGAIKTVGQGANTARLAFYTYAVNDSSQLRERMTILDDGKVGIGTASPSVQLDVIGSGRFLGNGPGLAGVEGFNTGNSYFATGVRGVAAGSGVIGLSSSNTGIGVLGYVSDGGVTNFPDGAGVYGFSNQGHGVVGRSTRVGYAGVYGTVEANEGIGGFCLLREHPMDLPTPWPCAPLAIYGWGVLAKGWAKCLPAMPAAMPPGNRCP